MERLQVVLFNSTAFDFTHAPGKVKCEHFKMHEDGKNTVNFVITEIIFLYIYICVCVCVYIYLMALIKAYNNYCYRKRSMHATSRKVAGSILDGVIGISH
jgi:hypothetical protein